MIGNLWAAPLPEVSDSPSGGALHSSSPRYIFIVQANREE
jgi:hypothetical protein